MKLEAPGFLKKWEKEDLLWGKSVSWCIICKILVLDVMSRFVAALQYIRFHLDHAYWKDLDA